MVAWSAPPPNTLVAETRPKAGHRTAVGALGLIDERHAAVATGTSMPRSPRRLELHLGHQPTEGNPPARPIGVAGSSPP